MKYSRFFLRFEGVFSVGVGDSGDGELEEGVLKG